MAINITVIPSETFPTGKVTKAQLKRAAKPTVQAAGIIGTSDLAPGAVTPAKASPGAYFFSGLGGIDAGIMVIDLDPPLTGLVDGAEVWLRSLSRNAGAITMVVNDLPDKPVKKNKGEPLVPGDILIDQICGFRYDAQNLVWQMISPVGMPVNNYYVDTGADNAFVITPSPAFAAYSELTGRPLRVKLAHANPGGACTLAVNGVATPPALRKLGTVVPKAGDLVSGQVLDLVFDGTYFQIVCPVKAGVEVRVWAKFKGDKNSIVFNANAGTNLLTTGAPHGLTTGDAFSMNSSGAPPDPLTEFTPFFARVISVTTVYAYLTAADAIADTNRIDITTAGTGTHEMDIVPIYGSAGILAIIRASTVAGDYLVYFTAAFTSAHYFVGALSKGGLCRIDNADAGAADRKRIQVVDDASIALDSEEIHFVAIGDQ